MFRVLTPIIRSSYNCNYSFWYWLTGSTAIRLRCWIGTQQRERMVVDPVDQCQKLNYSCTSSWWWVSTVGTQQRERMVVDLFDQCQKLNYSCTSSWWWVSTVGTQQRERMVVDPVDQCQKLNYSCTSSWWWVSKPKTCRAAYRNVINWISRILLDSY